MRAAIYCAMTVLALTTTPGRAEACGGFFSAWVQQPMGPATAVDQSGENLIFVMGGELAEVHIQVSYDPSTNADEFAWIIPLAAVPEFSVGSQPFFDQVRAATVPLFGLSTVVQECQRQPTSGGDEGGGPGTAPEWSDGGEDAGDTEPDVILQETVGVFDVVVLQDTQLAPIQMWLEMNGYTWNPDAAPILQEYLDEGNVIAALKLTRGAELQDVHPITLRYDGLETCFPLRLTRIAAVEDMDIRVFVLAESRAAPTNYRHVEINPLKIDWLNPASNYKQVIAQAVDASLADGRAFVTEFAGSSSAVSQVGIYDASWTEQEFVGLDPTLVVSTLNSQGLAACTDSFSCAWNHPLVYGLLLEHLPPPQGVDPLQFYPHLGDYADQIDIGIWNGGAGFSTALLSRVIEPGMHASELLDRWPSLTRMYTTISPDEMTDDPIFHTNTSLPSVAQLRQAFQSVLLSGDSIVRLPDNREVYVPNGAPWPAIPGDVWWAQEVQTIPFVGAPMTLADNFEESDAALEAWNLANDWPRPLDACPGGDDDPFGPTTSGDDGGGPSSGDDGDGPGDEGSGSEAGALDDDKGCGCRGDQGSHGLWLALGLLAWYPRRRR